LGLNVLIFEKNYRRESMNKRGQAALEYLMTYGWALIVIAIVVGVLVFIVSSPGGDVVCSSSDPAKINVKASQVDGAPTDTQIDFGTIILTNLTGGNMSDVNVTSVTGAFVGNGISELGLSSTYTSGQEITLSPDELTDSTNSPHGVSTIVISYTDYASLTRSATITCSGPITTI
jgi:uncharacterized protein (UPF0333 family)